MHVTALLPMKGHSERVPGKNLRKMGDKPLFFHVATTLQQCELVDTIVINTDSESIADQAEKKFSKVRINWRPEDICGDFVSMNTIIDYDLQHNSATHFLQTHSTNPLLSVKTLTGAVESYFAKLGEYDSLFSVTRLQTRLYWESGAPINHSPEELLRTQDLPPVFEENSNMYIFNKESFAASGKNRIGVKPQMFVMDPLEAMDIDEECDFIMAERLLAMQNL